MTFARGIVALLLLTVLALTGCAGTTKPLYVVPEAIGRAQVHPISTWAGTPVSVVDGRPAPAAPLSVAWVDTGLTWESYSTAVVQETRRALLEALGPARPEGAAELRVTIRENAVRFDAPNWVSATVLEAQVFRAGQPTTQRWMARGQDQSWNWKGMATAGASNQKAYETAVLDLLRQLALSRPPE